MAARRTRAELEQLRGQRIPDNPLNVITPAAVREVLAEMDESALNLSDDGLPAGPGGATGYGSLTGMPTDSAPLAAALRRGPNARPDLWKEVTHMTRAEAGTGGGAVFEELDFTACCVYTTIIVEFYRETPTSAEILGQRLVAQYDGGPSPAYRICRDGSFDTSALLPARFVRIEDARAFTPYASVPAGYLWATNQYASAYVSGQTTEQFFQYVGPDATPAPAPTGTGSDAGIWVAKNRTDVPTVAPAGAWRYIGDPADNNTSEGPLDPTVTLNNSAGGPTPANIRIGAGCANIAIDRSTQITIAPVVTNLIIDRNSHDVTVGPDCAYVHVQTNATRVRLYNCQGSVDPISGVITYFEIPPGATDAVYRNNVLVPDFDPYEVSLAIRQAVVDGFNTQDAAGNASPFLGGAQPAGSLVGMEFIDPQAEYLYKFRPVPFANGTFNVWCSGLLSR